MEPDRPVRVRFAPSPTGYLHIGGLRTALYNYLFARHHGGAFILRIEDTDQRRFVEGSIEDISGMLAWAGMEYDEGPERDGDCGPYFQSQRLPVYREHVNRLIEEGHGYYAFDTPEQLEAMRVEEGKKGNPAPKYDLRTRMGMSNSLTLSKDEVRKKLAAEEPFVVRMKIPEDRTVSWDDIVRGPLSFESRDLDDKVIFKSDGFPTYHLANVVDDHLMGITHVLRGEEWISSVPHHVLLYQYFKWTPPQFAHLPLLLNTQKKKLSKRDGDVETRQFRESGYLPEALVNFVAFLGWNPGDDRELFTLEELAGAFSMDRIGKSGAIFNVEKLQWYNAQYLRAFTEEQIFERLEPEFARHNVAMPEKPYALGLIRLMRERVSFISEFITSCRYFYEDPDAYDAKAVRKRWKPESLQLLQALESAYALLDPFNAEQTETVIRQLAEKHSVNAADLIHPLRLAVTGVPGGPGLFETLALIGREAVVRRLQNAVSRFDAVVAESAKS